MERRWAANPITVLPPEGDWPIRFPGFSRAWSPADIAAVQLQVFAAYLESAQPWTRTWGVFFQTSGERITAFVRVTAQEFRKQSAKEPAIDEAGKRPIQP